MATKITGTVSGDPLIEVEIGGVFYPWKQAIENWATVTAVTGSPTSASYTDADGVEWTYYQWTGSGSVTVTAGVVDALVVGAGTSTTWTTPGRTNAGIIALLSGASSIAVGATSGDTGNGSSIGSYSVAPVRSQSVSQPTNDPALVSSITGTSIGYAAQTGSTYGCGLRNGVVIIRVPSQFAQA